RCGQCLTSCPTYLLSMNEAEGPRGRIALMRALVEGHLPLTPDLVEHEQNCLVCDACTAVCPAGVHMDPMQVALRAAIEPDRPRPAAERIARRVGFGLLADLGRLRSTVRLLALAQALRLPALAERLGLLRLLGLEGAAAFLPDRVETRFLIPRGERYPAEAAAGAADPPTSVAFFAGCVMSTALAEVDRATIRVLRRAGCEVSNTAGQGCCGALHAHSGDLAGARRLFKRNVEAFEREGEAPIVVNSAGCGAMLKDYGHHLRDEPEWAERARRLSARVVDATQLLAGRALPMRRSLPIAATYQDPCHLAHAQRISQPPRALLRSIPDLELREMQESSLCCGSAGVYNLTNPRESGQLQRRKLDRALATGARVIATANPGCLLQLRAGLRERGSDVQVRHVVELLDEATAP
ncbi:MAG TPA: heterodisulfide reductase-related iron-sulfur binding cluster, partial [Chloroflexota bacterium]